MDYRGFSLIEVLICLALMTGTSCALLQQHWQTRQFFNELLIKDNAIIEADDMAEKVMAES